MNFRDLKQRYHVWPEDLSNPRGTVVQIVGLASENYVVTESGVQVPKTRSLLRLHGYGVPFRLNNTRLDVLGAMFGENTDDWIGKKIGLYVAAANNHGKTEPTIFIHVEPCTDMPLSQVHPRVSAQSQLTAGSRAQGFVGEIQTAMSKFEPPQKGAVPPGGQTPGGFNPAAKPGTTMPFDVRPIGLNSAKNFNEAMAEQGIKLDDVIGWFKRHDPDTHERVWGQELADWPRGVAPAMQRCLREWPAEPTHGPARDPAAAPPPESPPPTPTPKPAIVPGATFGKPAPPSTDPDADDIPF